MRHPAEYYIKFLLVSEPAITDAQITKTLEDQGFLDPTYTEPTYYGFLRQSIPAPPSPFTVSDKTHRPSVQYLRDLDVYDMCFPTAAVEEAKSYLTNPTVRLQVEQVILSRLELREVARKLNKKYSWHLTEEGISAYRHYFWNVKLLTFDQWGKYLYERSALYDRYMALLQADRQLAMYHLRIDQTIESKEMIKEAQKIVYFNLLEVAQLPGVRADKVKAIGTLTKALAECHQALSTSDVALSTVLKEFERFHMAHPEIPAPDIKQLAPGGNYTGSGIDAEKDAEKEKAH